MRDAVPIEKCARHDSAYAPDVPGCVATGRAWDAVLDHLRAALIIGFSLVGTILAAQLTALIWLTRSIPK